MKNHHSFILLLIVLTGCSSYSSLSSFSSRKYTKGYFFNAPAEKPIVAERNEVLQTCGRNNRGSLNQATSQNIMALRPVQKLEQLMISLKKAVLSKKAMNPIGVSISRINTNKHYMVEKLLDDTPSTDKKNDYDWGQKGLLFIGVGLLGAFLFLMMAIIFAVSGTVGADSGIRTLAIIFLCIAMAALLVFLAGFVMCIIAVIHKDTGFAAILGLIIGAIVILLLTLSQLHAL
jgi:hypothetical protein